MEIRNNNNMLDEVTTANPMVQNLQTINTSLAAFEDRKKEHLALVEKSKTITMPEITDKAAIKKLRDIRIELMRARTRTEREVKDLRALVKPITDGISASGKALIDITSPEEERLKGLEDQIDEKLAEIEAEKERHEQARITGRIGRLMDAGCEFNGDRYSYAGYSLNTAEVKALDDPLFDEFHARVKDQYDKDQAALAEQKRIADLRDERQNQIRPYWHLMELPEDEDPDSAKESLWENMGTFTQEYFDKLLSDLQVKQTAIEEQVKENKRVADELAKQAQQLEQQKKDLKIQRLLALGLKWDGDHFSGDGVFIHWTDVVCWTDDKFEEELKNVESHIERRAAAIKEKERQDKLFDERSIQVIDAGMSLGAGVFLYGDKFSLNFDVLRTDAPLEWVGRLESIKQLIADDRAEKERKAEEERKQNEELVEARARQKLLDEQAEEAEKNRMKEEAAKRKAARAPDKVKVLAYLSGIRETAAPLPVMKDEHMGAFILMAQEKINEVLQVLETKVNEL